MVNTSKYLDRQHPAGHTVLLCAALGVLQASTVSGAPAIATFPAIPVFPAHPDNLLSWLNVGWRGEKLSWRGEKLSWRGEKVS